MTSSGAPVLDRLLATNRIRPGSPSCVLVTLLKPLDPTPCRKRDVEAHIHVSPDIGRLPGLARAACRLGPRPAGPQPDELLQGVQRPDGGIRARHSNAGSPAAPPRQVSRGNPPLTFARSARGASRRLRSGPPSPRAPPQVEVRSYADRTFDFDVSTPLSSYFLKKAAGVEKGTSKPGIEWVGSISVKEIYEIAKVPPSVPPTLRPQSARGESARGDNATLMVDAAAGQDDRPQAAGAFQPEDDVQVARSPVQVHRPEGI